LHYSHVMSDRNIRFGSSPKASSSGMTPSYGDRPTGQGFGGSNLGEASATLSSTSDTVFRKTGFGTSSDEETPSRRSSPVGSRSSGRGYGASTLNTSATKRQDLSSQSSDRHYAFTSGSLDNLYLTSILLDNAQAVNILRQEAFIDRELAHLDRKREYLQQRYNIDVPNYYEYEQEHPMRTPRISLGALASGVLGGATIFGMLTSGSGDAFYRITTTLAAGAVGGYVMAGLFNETTADVQIEHIAAYKEVLDQVERGALGQPQPQIQDTQVMGRITEPTQNLDRSRTF
jgi:hypothetical protein